MADIAGMGCAQLSRRPFILQTNKVPYLIAGGPLLPRFLGEDSDGEGVHLKILLDSRDRLLVQVHPDRVKARRYFGFDFGKTEACYVADAEKGAFAYAGSRPGFRTRWGRAVW
jgi:hypothetical protein